MAVVLPSALTVMPVHVSQ